MAAPGPEPRKAGQRQFEFGPEDFRFVADLVRQRSGIVLADNKQDMVYGRLSRRLRALGMTTFNDYCAFVKSPEGREELTDFTNALTTNLTSFFRENHHFEHLRDVVLPHCIAKAEAGGGRRLRLWSAGSSSGEEAYSAAMILHSTLPHPERWDARILATDIDSSMVAQGRAGVYDAERVARIPDSLRKRFIQPVPGRPDKVQMAPLLRQTVAFKRLNLLGAWPVSGPFDVIFCRNVAIYFDKPTQARLYGRLGELLAEDGFLYIGHAENLLSTGCTFKAHGRTIYSRV